MHTLLVLLCLHWLQYLQTYLFLELLMLDKFLTHQIEKQGFRNIPVKIMVNLRTVGYRLSVGYRLNVHIFNRYTLPFNIL